ncbi:TetR/AcrR family transcriptional regulator [Vibrio methylphosphonaticus]|uniref:TetR/AcrR family transcriptional regulator n=1 Tax=Vibrio methylphosphonaticus TaxID=2946866 RepID=UPI002029B9E9|nr:TetR/AcrR family transcriptional regulator [Vibrio methylphosphonaticus]MCL9776875.1 TetR/AcrR family transcriptional regulator [Vibrio methylphosphonaticus]
MTVKPKKRGRPSKSGAGLSQKMIVETAKKLMQGQGSVPSIRKLAAELGMDAMAIYHYFRNKDELLEAVAISLVEGIYQPTGLASWQEELTELGWSYLTLLSDYPGLLETLLKMRSSGPAEVFITRFERVISDIGLTADSKKNAVNLLADYLHGYAFSMQFTTIVQEERKAIYTGSISLYLNAISLGTSASGSCVFHK